MKTGEKIDKGGKAVGDVSESSQTIPLLSDMLFSRQPHLFNGILFWGIAGERHEMHVAFGHRAIPIERPQIGLDLSAPMIPGAIPTQDHRPTLMPPPQPFQKGHRVHAIPGRCWKERRPSGEQIEGPIIRLPGALIRDRHLHPFPTRPPHIAQHISPDQMAFIEKADHEVFRDNPNRLRDQFFFTASRVSATTCGSTVGFRFWAFFLVIRASANKA